MTGGKAHACDVSIGVLCLDTSFTKIPGHIRNTATFEFPVRYRVVSGATAQRVVVQADAALIRPFIEAARDLERQGVSAITTACGFLVLFQQHLADAVDVPVFASSLIQLPMVRRMLRADQKVGVLTARKQSLTRRHLRAVGAASVPICVAGLDDSPEFREVMLEARRDDLNAQRLEADVLEQVDALARENPDMGALVIECTDLPPFAQAIQRRLKLPVFDIVTLTDMVYRGLTRPRYG